MNRRKQFRAVATRSTPPAFSSQAEISSLMPMLPTLPRPGKKGFSRHPYFHNFDTAGNQQPLALAHRGYAGVFMEAARTPEKFEDAIDMTNTWESFQAAVDLGYRYIETDVRATKDGVVVVFHNAALDDVTTITGRISDMTWNQVQHARLRGNRRIVRLEDVLTGFPESRFNLDVKDRHTVRHVADVIDRTKAHDRVLIASFDDHRSRAVVNRLSAGANRQADQHLHPSVPRSAGTLEMIGFRLGTFLHVDWLARWSLRAADCLQVPERFPLPVLPDIPVVTPRTVRKAHEFGKFVHVWGVDNKNSSRTLEATMNRLLAMGVDGFVPDRARAWRDALRNLGKWVGPSTPETVANGSDNSSPRRCR